MKPYPTLSCPAYAELVDAVLDRTTPIQLLDHPHVQSCPSCHGLSMAARLIIAGVPRPSVSVNLTQRIVNAALTERQTRQRQRFQLRAAAMVAMLLMGVVSFSLWRQNDIEMQTDVAEIDSSSTLQPPVVLAQLEPKPPRLEESVNEASNALMEMTGDVTSPVLFTTRSFHVPSELPQWTPAETNNSLVNLPNTASTGIEPVTSSTRRALNLFMRDTGFDTELKSKF